MQLQLQLSLPPEAARPETPYAHLRSRTWQSRRAQDLVEFIIVSAETSTRLVKSLSKALREIDRSSNAALDDSIRIKDEPWPNGMEHLFEFPAVNPRRLRFVINSSIRAASVVERVNSSRSHRSAASPNFDWSWLALTGRFAPGLRHTCNESS